MAEAAKKAGEVVAVDPGAQVAAIRVYGENGAIGAVLLTAVIVILMLGVMLWRVIGMYRSLAKDVLATNSTHLEAVQALAVAVASTGAKLDVILQMQASPTKGKTP